MEKRYGALRTIAAIYKVLGAIAGILTLLAALAICAIAVLGGSALIQQLGGDMPGATNLGLFSSALGGLIVAVLVILYGGFAAGTLFALGQGMDLLLALEENTRATAMVLQARRDNP
jgi:hypothetical protein